MSLFVDFNKLYYIYIQDSSIPSTDLPPHCQDSSIPQHIDLDQSKISQVDISKDSSVSNTISTEEVLVIEGQFNDVPSSCSRSCSTEFPPSHVLCPTPESDTEVIKLCSLQDKQLVRLFDEDKKELLLSPSTVIPNYVPDVVCGQNNAGVSTHVLSSNVVTFPSHSDTVLLCYMCSEDRFTSHLDSQFLIHEVSDICVTIRFC